MSNSLAKVHPELVSEWSERNFPLTPDNITYGSNKRVWWKGSCGHEWQASVKARSKGEGCPICSGARVVEGINDLATLGHKDISTTLNIYTDVTKELRRSEFEGLDSYFKNEYNKANEVL